MNLPRFVIVLPMLALAAIATAADGPKGSKLYKWVDEKGVTHYTQTLPGDVNQKGNTELDRRGRVLRKNDAALSEDQIRAIEDEKIRLKQSEKRMEEQRRKDNALINTYTTEAEIDGARDRAVGGATQALQAIEVRLKGARAQLATMTQHADKLRKANKPVPDAITEEISSQQADIAKVDAEHLAKKAEIQRIRDRYESDKTRFRELMSVGRK
jgi:chromosome segregation ATPase